MKTYNLPANVDALIFDIDNTLYRNDNYCELQVQLLIERFAKEREMTVTDAVSAINRGKMDYQNATGGKKTSTGNVMLNLGVALDENARWRDELFGRRNTCREILNLFRLLSISPRASSSRLSQIIP